MEWPGPLEGLDEVDIETRREDGAPLHRTTIWAVVGEGEVYVRSLRGTSGRWYRELSANPDAVLHVGADSIPVRAIPATDPNSIELASAGYRRKYSASSELASMLRDQILDTTLRLEPR
jgi:hypothetical protein